MSHFSAASHLSVAADKILSADTAQGHTMQRENNTCRGCDSDQGSGARKDANTSVMPAHCAKPGRDSLDVLYAACAILSLVTRSSQHSTACGAFIPGHSRIEPLFALKQ
jgi:hypothetical protein